MKTKLQARRVKSSSNHAPMTTFFRRQSVDVLESVTTVEVLFSFFVAEHNLPANVSDHFTDLVPRLFSDSAIAKAFRCKRTKTTQIVRWCLAPTATHRDGPFSLMVDESTDRNTDQRLVILERYFEGEKHTRLSAGTMIDHVQEWLGDLSGDKRVIVKFHAWLYLRV